MAVNPTDCRNKLTGLAQKDPFFSQRDQRPLLDRILSDIDTAVKAALQQAEERLDETGQQLDAELAETAEQLRKAAEQLAEEFAATLRGKPLTAEALTHLSQSIEGRILWLYDRVRARLERSMRRISLKGRLLGEILQTLSDVWSQSCREMPAELVLILDRQQQQVAAGRSIWEIEGPPLLDRACEGHGFLASRLLYLRQRHRLRRRYKIIRSEPCETLNRHQPAPLHNEPPASLVNCQSVHDETNRALADLWRNLRFNLENAAEDCCRLVAELGDAKPAAATDQRLEETAKLAGETLARSAEQLTTVAAPLKQAWQQWLTDLERDRHDILALIPRDLQRELTWQERLQHRRRHLARTRRLWLEQVKQRLEKPRQLVIAGWAKTTAFVRRLLGQPGSTLGREETLLKLTDLPTPREILARATDLPPVCRRLFTIGALKNREFLVGKEEHLETLGDLFRRWQEGKLCSVAVVGPNGSGKTSLINCFQSELGNKAPILRLGIEQRIHCEQQLIELCCRWFELPSLPENLADLEAQLLQLPPTVLIVENIHRLLLRTPGGLECLRAFLRLVLASRRRLLWVITCRKYPWQRMQHLLQIDRYFSHQLQTLFGTQAEMRDALLLRLQTSSYPVIFLKNSTNGSEPNNNNSDQETLQERFFADLFTASRGNMQAALYYWLLCLDYDHHRESLTVRPLGKLDYGSLRSLDRQQFYALAEIIAHGELTAAEHAAIFACDLLRSDMLLGHLVQLNLLEYAAEEDEAGRYRLNPLFFAPATATLEGRNILQ